VAGDPAEDRAARAARILAGFRITASIALILLVSAEMIGAQYGIGQLSSPPAGNRMLADRAAGPCSLDPRPRHRRDPHARLER
jgi:hypothetical protein